MEDINNQVIQPPRELKSYVSHFWSGRWNKDVKAGAAYFATANTNTELAFGFEILPGQPPRLIFSSLLGHTKSHRQIPVNGNIELFGASIFSHAVPHLFDIAPAELAGQYMYMDMLPRSRGAILNEQMAETVTLQQRVRVLLRYFRSQLEKKTQGDSLIIHASRQIKIQRGTVSIPELASAFCLSKKQFERRFAACSGFNPKLYARIIRFENALWHRSSYDSLTEVAHAYGYYDQAHFIHEFKAFSGYSPQQFFSLAGY